MTYKINSARSLFLHSIVGATICTAANAQYSARGMVEKKIPQHHENCTLLSDPDGWSIAAGEPGNYCLGKSLKQSSPIIKFQHQSSPRSPLISIYSSDVSLDLRGFHLSSSTPNHSGVYTNFLSSENNLPTTIKNGEITTTDDPAIYMVDMWNMGNKRFGRGYALASSEGDISKYKPTVFVLENLTIKSDQHTIIMQGKRNVIRNCKIIGGNETVNIYGPNLLFEENTIITNITKPGATGNEQPVALYLEDAANSIVRNNNIVINGPELPNSSAIALVNSQDVLIENNTITGTKKIYKLVDDLSSARAFGNQAR